MNWFVLTAAAIPAGYQLVSIAACLKRLAFRQKLTGFTPAVSILKPVRGADPNFYEAIKSQAEIDYPEYEVLFGIADSNDSALPHIHRLQAEFPDKAIRIIQVTTETLNGKVGALIDLERSAKYNTLVISDADIKVPTEYLRKVIAPLEDPGNGLVTCLYRASAGSFAGLFEVAGVETDFAPSALVAPLVGVDEFAFGSTIAVRRADLARSGGLGPIADYIADDYQIGKRIHALNLKCVLAETVVDTDMGAPSFAVAWAHQVRWARTIRVSRPGGYFGLFVTFATLWSLAVALAGEPMVGLALFALRMIAGHIAQVNVLKSRPAGAMVSIRDLAFVAVWIAGLLPGKVVWRGQKMVLMRDGRIRNLI